MENSQNISERPAPGIAMSIQAHPDDQDFTIAATLAKWAKQGTRIISVMITHGEAGTNAKDWTPQKSAELAVIREQEQRAANRILAIQETVFLDYPDGVLQSTMELRRDLTRIIRRYKPDVVLTGDPTTRFFGNDYMNHPDHRAAADAACDAVFPSAVSRPIFPELLAEGLEPHQVKAVYLHGSTTPNEWVNVQDTIEMKIEALRQHHSQLNGWDPAEEMRKWAAEAGAPQGLPFAESFRVMVLTEA